MNTKLYSLFILFFMLPSVALAGDTENRKGRYVKEKKISKAYYVNPTAGLDITNKYGNVYVTTWDEDKTSIDITITVSGNKEEQVIKRLSSIDVDIEALKGLITARTKIGNFSGGKTSMEINYTVKIPRKGSVKLNNQYGGIKLGKIYSKCDINCKYGDFNADELNSDSNTINLEYCGSTNVGYIKNAILNAKYSEFNVARAGKLLANCEYTGLRVTDIDDITYRCDYGELQVGTGDRITGTSNYLSTRFGKVNSQLNITANYGDIKVNNLSKTVRNVAINASYTGINLKYAEDYAFDFEIFLKYDGLESSPTLKFQQKKEKYNESYYRGFHKNSGINKIFVKSEYGHLSMQKI